MQNGGARAWEMARASGTRKGVGSVAGRAHMQCMCGNRLNMLERRTWQVWVVLVRIYAREI
jgi:hypothetical protein